MRCLFGSKELLCCRSLKDRDLVWPFRARVVAEIQAESPSAKVDYILGDLTSFKCARSPHILLPAAYYQVTDMQPAPGAHDWQLIASAM